MTRHELNARGHCITLRRSEKPNLLKQVDCIGLLIGLRIMPLIVCYYHVVWATKHRVPSISPDVEALIFPTMIRKSETLKSLIHAINGIEDHVHIAVSLAPSLALADWVRQIKGISAHEVNQNFPDLEDKFRWQAGYSAHTFGQKALSNVLEYIQNQKSHHAEDDVIVYLETMEDESRNSTAFSRFVVRSHTALACGDISLEISLR
jgi:putative transposase